MSAWIIFLYMLGLLPGILFFFKFLATFVLLIILFNAKAWQSIYREEGRGLLCLFALGVAVSFVLITAVKGVFEVISYVFLLPYI